jgi:hypothetical protein
MLVGGSAWAGEPADLTDVAGTVGEVIDAGGHTFLRIEVNGEPVWAVGPEIEVTVGDTVRRSNATLIADFYSNQLERRFERIYFTRSIAVERAPAVDAGP